MNCEWRIRKGETILPINHERFFFIFLQIVESK